jgi:hypothetical protein
MTFNTNNGENYDDVMIVHHPLPPVGKKGARTSPLTNRKKKFSPVRLPRLPRIPSGNPGPPRPKRTNYIQRRFEDAKNSVNDDDFVAFVKNYHKIQ